jgi:hypothetical protein
MNTQEKGELIGKILLELKISAFQNKKEGSFSDGSTFLALAFKTDAELITIAKVARITV